MLRRLSLRISAALLLIFILSLVVLAQETSAVESEQKVKELISSLNPENFINLIFSGIPDFLKQISGSFLCSLSVLVITAVFNVIGNNLKVGGKLFGLLGSCIMILSCSLPISLCFEKVSTHLTSMCAYIISFIPSGAVLHAASGNTLSASLMSSSGYYISVLEFISASVILPLSGAYMSISTANSLFGKTELDGISNMIKSFCLWATGLTFTLFTGVLSLQSILASSADSLAMKSLKFGASRFIPIAGGMVSESIKTVIANVSLIKSVTGISGVIFIIYAVLPPLCAIIGTKIYFGILCAFSKSTQKGSITTYLQHMTSCINILAALILGCSASFIIMLGLFIKTTVNF